MRQFKPGQLQTGSLYNISSSYAITASYVLPLTQQIVLSGSFKLDPIQDPDPNGIDLDSTVFFQSSSNTALGYDLYVRQNGNLVKWKWIEGSLETGLLYGGAVTYSGSNVFVSPGSGIIADHNATTGSEVSPMIEYVTWNAITQSITNIATQQVTYLYINNNGALQQQSTRFTSQQYHDYIPLGAVGHFDYTQVSAFSGGVQTAYDQISQISNFVDAFGPLKMSGYGLTGQAGSLRLSVGAGTSFIHGGFYQNNPEFPSQITTPSQATASLARVYRSGSSVIFDTNGGALYTTVNPTQYDRDGDGTLENVGNGNWSIQRVFTDPKTGVLYVYYGQERYTTLLNALQYLPTDPFTEGDTFDFTTFVGYLVLRGNASDLTDTSNNSIINGGLFRGSGQGSGGGIALSNLDDLTDVSIVSPTNGQALIYDDAIWKNGTPLSASYALTSSYATNALSASYAPSTPAFPYTGSALITGSLGVTGSASILAYTSSAVKIFSVRNSANTYDIISNYGSELTIIGRNESTEPRLLVDRLGSTRMLLGGTTDLNITFPSSGYGQINTGTQGLDVIATSGDIRTRNSSTYTLLKGNFFGIGQATPAARLDVRAQGALSTDIAFRVRTSADTRDNLQILGTGESKVLRNTFGQNIFSISYVTDTNTERDAFRFTNSVQNAMGRTWTFNAGYNGAFEGLIISNDLTGNNLGVFTIQSNNYCFGTSILNAEGSITERRVLRIANGVAPTTSKADEIKFYSADITAGNAAPHFRTENGSIIKLYKEIQPALSGSANTGDAATDDLIEAMKTIILNLGLGSSS